MTKKERQLFRRITDMTTYSHPAVKYRKPKRTKEYDPTALFPDRRPKKKPNPVRIAATMTGKSTGWMPAKAVRVRVVKGRRIVDVKK